MYNAHPYFSLKTLVKKCTLYAAKCGMCPLLIPSLLSQVRVTSTALSCCACLQNCHLMILEPIDFSESTSGFLAPTVCPASCWLGENIDGPRLCSQVIRSRHCSSAGKAKHLGEPTREQKRWRVKRAVKIWCEPSCKYHGTWEGRSRCLGFPHVGSKIQTRSSWWSHPDPNQPQYEVGAKLTLCCPHRGLRPYFPDAHAVASVFSQICLGLTNLPICQHFPFIL